MAYITTLVLCARSQDLVMSCQCVGYMSFSRLLDLRAEESRVVRHVKPPRYGEASKRPHALSRARTQAIDALVQGPYPLSYPSGRVWDKRLQPTFAPRCFIGCLHACILVATARRYINAYWSPDLTHQFFKMTTESEKSVKCGASELPFVVSRVINRMPLPNIVETEKLILCLLCSCRK